MYIKFIEYIIENFLNKGEKFYNIYNKYEKQKGCDIYNFQNNEKYEYVPIIINYRPLLNVPYFLIKYRIKHFCSGKCKFMNQPVETLNSTPYIDIPLVAYEDNLAKIIQDIFLNYIYINLNTICQEEICVKDENTLIKLYIKIYEIIEIPLILSINPNIN